MLLENVQLVVSRLFAGDNRLSPDILLVTTGCHQTFCWWQPVVSRPKSLVTTGCQQTSPSNYYEKLVFFLNLLLLFLLFVCFQMFSIYALRPIFRVSGFYLF